MIFFAVLWVVTLVRVLTRKDFDPVTRFMWVFIVVSLNIFGVIIYMVVAPRVAAQESSGSFEESDPLPHIPPEKYFPPAERKDGQSPLD